jgi:hypothetical protein
MRSFMAEICVKENAKHHEYFKFLRAFFVRYFIRSECWGRTYHSSLFILETV